MGRTAQIFGRDVELDGWPSVAVVMPVRNEEAHLESAVKAILDQQYPEPFEVCLAVGPSEDDTTMVAQRLAEAHPSVSVVANPSGITPAGLNAAIAATASDVVVRVDGHSVLSDGYIRTAVETMIDTGAVNVGGLQHAVGTTPFEEAVAAAMTSRIGTGGAKFHIGGEPGPVDTVYLGVFDRAAGEAVGWFDERLVRNQDYELNIRLREAGGTVWFTPELSVEYRPRSTWRGLAKQYYEYGYWKAVVARLHPTALRPRQIAAALVPITLFAALLVGLSRKRRLLFAPVVYLALVALSLAPRDRPRATAIVMVQQCSWGLGFWSSIGRSRSIFGRSTLPKGCDHVRQRPSQ